MIEIGKTNFSANYWHEEHKLLEFHWTNQEIKEMKEVDYKEALLKCAGIVEKHKPVACLLNSSTLTFLIVPELQEWADENINAVANKFIKKMAIILPASIVQQISMEQIFNEEEGKKFQTHFFDNYQGAFDWLTSE